MRALELKIPPAVIFLAAAAVMWLLARAVPALGFELSYPVVAAASVAVPGLIVAILGIREFRRLSTTVNPTRPGEASAIVTAGVYRLTRNPMYLGLACCTVAWGLYLQNTAALLFVIVFVAYMTHFQIKPEERALREKFGDEYERFSSRVRRWL